MTRATTIAVVVAAVLVAAAGSWAVWHRMAERPAVVAGSVTDVSKDTVEDLLMDLQVIPLDAEAAKPFALVALDGRSMTTADLAGQPALLYFWATW